jgi:hypothetical protein
MTKVANDRLEIFMDLSSLTNPLKENETAAAVNLELLLLLLGCDWGSRV